MLSKIANSLSELWIKKSIISSCEKEIYIYGIEIFISSVFSLLVVLLIGSLFSSIIKTITFLLVFVPLRRFTGGYHASTYFKCCLASSTVFSLTLLLDKYWNINFFLVILLILLCLIVIILLSPIDNINKILSDEKKKKNKHKAIAYTCIIDVVIMVMLYFSINLYSITVLSLLDVCILMIIGYEKNKKERRLVQ